MDNDLNYLLQKLREGDEDTYVYLFRKYYIQLCAYSRRYVGRKDIAEELVSETFFNIWKNREALEIHSSLKGYLFHAVCNNSLSFLRKQKREESLDEFLEISNDIHTAVTSDESPSDSLIFSDLNEAITKAVDALPSQQKKAFCLKRYEGKKNAEIAEIMGISVKTVEMHLSRSVLTLRRNLKEYLPEFLVFLALQNIL